MLRSCLFREAKTADTEMGIRIYVRAVFGFCPQVTELEFHVNLIGPPLYFHKTLVKDP